MLRASKLANEPLPRCKIVCDSLGSETKASFILNPDVYGLWSPALHMIGPAFCSGVFNLVFRRFPSFLLLHDLVRGCCSGSAA
jgi:hypothetical protein